MAFPPGIAPRCLDTSHSLGCTACTPAPGEAELAGFQLHASAEQLASFGRSAEKHLRSLVSRTPEWASADEREQLAATAPPHLARALRKRLCSALRKADMVALCRCACLSRSPRLSQAAFALTPFHAGALLRAGPGPTAQTCGGPSREPQQHPGRTRPRGSWRTSPGITRSCPLARRPATPPAPMRSSSLALVGGAPGREGRGAAPRQQRHPLASWPAACLAADRRC